MAASEYQRLTRTKSQHGVVTSGRSSLWLGPDHLLRIDSSGYTENYRRFFLRDIQAVIIRKTDGLQIRILVHGIFMLIWVLSALSAADPIWRGVWWALTGVSLVLLVINLLLGPCCAFHIKTAVQNEAIPSINRLRKAREVLERLRPLLVSAQGQLSPEEILARYQPAAQAVSAEAVGQDVYESPETVPAAIPLASDIPNPTATGAAPASGPNSSPTATG